MGWQSSHQRVSRPLCEMRAQTAARVPLLACCQSCSACTLVCECHLGAVPSLGAVLPALACVDVIYGLFRLHSCV